MKDESLSPLDTMRHSAAHVMAAAVCRLFENVQLDIGPATDDGFYYDFDLPHRLAPEDFTRIEEEMRKIIAENHPFERLEVSRAEAEQLIREKGQRYKIERLADIPEGQPITFFRSGDFIDLCRGPHLPSTGGIQAIKLLSVAGSYYRGRETNPMLQRLYGTAFETQKDLDFYLKQIEEAKRRDHRVLGRDLDLFSMQEAVGPGLIHWHPRGARIRSIIEEFWRQEHFKNGYDLLYTPHIGRSNLWETSGHLGFYRESMYAPMKIDEVEYFIKPMNCPFHIQIYKTHKRSYRDLPLRWAELGTVYRYEKAGVLAGLFRVRGFTQDDAHIYCTPEQVEDEVLRAMHFAIRMWKTFGFSSMSAYLSTRPDKAVGEPERWEQATRSLEQALKEAGIPYEVDPGGGAFYGPKIDMRVKDAIGREWQMSTIQFDFNLPERFDMAFTGADGKDHRPYMVHRALFGSIERFFGILTEHYAGAFPFWLAPEQARVLPLTDKQAEYARSVAAALRDAGFRVGLDERPEKLGARIRDAQLMKIPYMLVAGGREAEAKTVAVRSRTEGDRGAVDLPALITMWKAEEDRRGLAPG
ncbi:MAG TPA: threonine--tRNA ligase [Kiritimatiellia bacterium]|nr:threonine--tRNA ligase [Kiritimatiellia bacterium]HSA18957.1 threonine--tRNA ligase [Kiritimatiellia bacterium]